MKKSNKQYVLQTVTAALLIALKIVLERLMSYSVWNQRFGFAFIAVAFAAAMLGTPWAMAVAGIGDILGALLFPSGAYFPGFTLTAVLTAACTAFFIHKNATLLRVTLSVIINQLFGSVLLNSLWISVLYGKGAFPAGILVLLTALSLVLIVQGFRRSPVKVYWPESKVFKKILAFIGLFYLYLVTLTGLGELFLNMENPPFQANGAFSISTFLFLLIALPLLGRRKPIEILSVAVLTTAVLVFAFGWFFQVLLP